jgi:hypothetical protein
MMRIELGDVMLYRSDFPLSPDDGLGFVFEKKRAMLCLWVNGQLNTAIREPSGILELHDRLKEWLQELR